MAGRILVVGANGHVGGPLVQALLEKGAAVKAASRGGAAAGGAKGVRFDLNEPATLGPALDGVDGLYLLMPGGDLRVEALLTPVIGEAAKRNVKVVLQTALGVDASEDIPYRKVELALERSGARYVILRPNWFADNFHTFWLAGVRAGVIRLPAGDGQTSFIDVRDIASSAAAALTSEAYDGKAWNLTGPAALGYADAARIISETTGRALRYEPISDDEFVAQASAGGVPEAYARFLTVIFKPVRNGWTAATTPSVETLTGKAPRSLEAYVRDHATQLGS